MEDWVSKLDLAPEPLPLLRNNYPYPESLPDCESVISEVIPGLLYQSGCEASVEEIQQLGIQHAIQLANPEFFPFRGHVFHIYDEDSQELTETIEQTNRILHTAIDEHKEAVLVQCHMGVSRSSAIILAYLCESKRVATLKEAYNYLLKARRCICPNWGFLQQLEKKYE